MSYSVDFAAALEDDLAKLRQRNAPLYALWQAAIDAICEIEDVAELLGQHQGAWPNAPRFNTVPVGGLLRRHYNINRIKLEKPDGTAYEMRLLYAMDHRTSPSTIWLLGLMPRAENYHPSKTITQRVLSDYDALEIPRV